MLFDFLALAFVLHGVGADAGAGIGMFIWLADIHILHSHVGLFVVIFDGVNAGAGIV